MTGLYSRATNYKFKSYPPFIIIPLKKCVKCYTPINTTVKTRNRKYCDICKIVIWKRQKKEYDIKKSIKRKLINLERKLSCVECMTSLPINSHRDRLYCDKCLILLKREKRRVYYLNSLTLN